MKKVLRILLPCIFIISFIFIFLYFPKEQYLKIKLDNKSATLKYKGLKDARDFTIDNSGNYYIAYKNKIQIIETNGKSYELLNSKELDIYSLCSKDKTIYFSSKTKVYSFDLLTKKSIEIIKDIPNHGDYKESILRIFGDNLYITIGAATNSGIVGDDNSWKETQPYFHDIPPVLLTLKGTNFGQDKTGAFQSYKSQSSKGQIVSSHFPGNGSVIIFNIKTGNSETFAYGIRNIKGMDFTKEGKLTTVVGGFENRGSRPIIGDSDYIYEIDKGNWYGWPDYSGGDPVDSPRFKGKNGSKVNFILENHPNTNPPAPKYQDNLLGELGDMAIDTTGAMGDINSIYFYKNGSIFSLDKKNILKEEFILQAKTKDCKIKFYKDQLLIYDGFGNIFLINSKNI